MPQALDYRLEIHVLFKLHRNTMGPHEMPKNLDDLEPFLSHLREKWQLLCRLHNFPKTGLLDMSRHICVVENSRLPVRGVTKRIAA
jgi:hypothetical protein